MKRGTLFFTLIVLLVAGYAFYDYQSEKKEVEKKIEQSVLLNLKVDQIQQVLIRRGSSEIQIQREKDGWLLTKPVQDATNASAVSEFLEGLATEKFSDVAREGSQIDFSAFGLEQPQGTITVQDNAGVQVRFSIGEVKNFQGDAFLRVNEDQRVFVVSSTWFAKLQKKADDFRDRRWMRMPAAGVFKMDISRNFEKGSEKFELIKKENSWFAPQQENWKLDQNKVREILSMLSSSEGIEVVADAQKPARKEELAKWGFSKPRTQMKVFLKEGTEEVKSWEGKFSLGGDQVHRLQTSPPEMVHKISPTDSDKFAHLSLDSLRDSGEPFQFDKTKIKKISWSEDTSKGKTVNVAQEQGQWKSPDGDVDSEKVKVFLDKLTSLKVHQFLTKKEKPGNQKLSLWGEDGKELFSLHWSPLNKEEFLVQSSSYSEVFSLLAADIESLKFNQIQKKTEVNK